VARVVLLVAVVVALAGCGSNGDSKSDDAKSTWAGPPKADSAGKVPVVDFNQYLKGDGQAFASSPIAAVTEFLGLDNSSAAETTMVATSPAEVQNYSEVVATLNGLLDDSVRAARYTVELHRDQESPPIWSLRAADWAQQCQPGRGHQSFTPQPCV
jgi:hypothetical protein